MSHPVRTNPAHRVRDEQELQEDQHTHFRALAARANLLAADRPDGIMFAAKEICPFRSKPSNIAPSALEAPGPVSQGPPQVGIQVPEERGRVHRGLLGHRLGRLRADAQVYLWSVLNRRQPHHQGMIFHTGKRGIAQRWGRVLRRRARYWLGPWLTGPIR